jgi:hypothetical protein
MMMKTLTELPLQKLKQAVGIREQIEALTLELNELLGESALIATNGSRLWKRRGLTESGRARIAAAQRERWSKYNAGRVTPEVLEPKQPRLSPAGRAKVAAAVKARWERFRAEKARLLRVK